MIKIRAAWEKLTGTVGEESLEARIFHAVCLISILTLAASAVFDYMIGIPELGLLMFSVLLLAVFFYYMSRYLKRSGLSIILFSLVSNVLFAVNFYYNSGINGPALLVFILAFFLTIAVAPKKQYGWWILVNSVFVISLLASSYYYPDTIKETYTDTASRYVDLGFSYVIIVLLVFLVTNYIRNNYILEKNLAEQRAKQLEESNATKNKLFSILAHDLRSPLSSIQNFLEILSEYKLEDEERESLQRSLLNETKNTQQMLANLLLWSKGQMDGVTVNLRELNLKETLQTTLVIQRTAASEKGILLKNGLNADTTVTADPDMLQLVIRNLVNNAIKFTPPGGEISITSTVEGACCRIVVTDNGMGIAADQQEGIFSLKAKSTFGTKNEKGVGLGLVLCKEFTELQHGTIGFQSTPGKGTSFFVQLASVRNHTDAGRDNANAVQCSAIARKR